MASMTLSLRIASSTSMSATTHPQLPSMRAPTLSTPGLVLLATYYRHGCCTDNASQPLLATKDDTITSTKGTSTDLVEGQTTKYICTPVPTNVSYNSIAWISTFSYVVVRRRVFQWSLTWAQWLWCQQWAHRCWKWQGAECLQFTPTGLQWDRRGSRVPIRPRRSSQVRP